ncbi:MAG: GNAT family N-acetyltransferase [Bacteroidia bacterium]|nr:GNAT family N-acetyltransferase [Bacteroidia bacterium]MCZ2247566.1 GNAT family N-acetyltransferase [Bacteroidia bacterium]
MQELIEPIDKKILKQELNASRFIRHTNNGSNEIYIVTHHDSPQVMQEIGRLRELTFRFAGGGTGKACDIDHYDTDEICYKQLIVWNPEDEEIVGGYRFIKCGSVIDYNKQEARLATSGLFKFSPKFIQEYMPKTIELGRSFVQPKYQPGVDARKGLFALDNIWDGLGSLIVDNPDIAYFFGKVTMYLSYNAKARDMILYFLKKFFPDHENLMEPFQPLAINTPQQELEDLFNNLDYKEAFKTLNTHVRALNENIPPLVNIYMNLSPSMKTFGTALNKSFGEVEETGILVTINDIYPTKKERHINSYIKK